MALESAKLGPILRRADPKAVVAFFNRASEDDRKTCVPFVLEWCALLDLNLRSHYNERARRELATREQIADAYAFLPAAHAAMIACATLPQIRSLAFINAANDDVVAILSQRRPPWVDAYAEFLCERELSRASGPSWRQVRALVRAGLCRPPIHDNYTLGAIEGIWPAFNVRQEEARRKQGLSAPTLTDLLLGEPDWLETAFWRLFELDGAGEVSLANAEKYGRSQSAWRESLLELSRRGVISRARLLDASLEALSRDFIQFRAGWYSRFHETLQPTPSERAERIDRYLNLLASSIAPTVTFALDAVVVVDATTPLPAKKLLPALPPALGATGKAVVKAALSLLDRVAGREPAMRSEICQTAVSGLLHEAADVQKLVFALLEQHADPQDNALRTRLVEVAEAVAASLRPRLQRWLGAKAAPPRAAPTTALIPPAPRTRPLDPARVLAPVTQLDDLLDLAGRVLETADNPDDIERVLDGISRLCDQRPEDFSRRTGPLRKRALKWAGPRLSMQDPIVHQVLARVVVAWLDQEDGFTGSALNLAGEQCEIAFLFRRLERLACQVAAGAARPLLSAPTHAGGWIDPHTVVDRWLEWQRLDADPDTHEQVLALLRLAPEGRADAVQPARALRGESGRALLHALGEASAPGRSAVWVAACRSAQPHGDLPALDEIQPNLGPDAGRTANYTWRASVFRPSEKPATWARFDCAVVVEPTAPRTVDDALLPVLFHLRKADLLHRHTPAALIRWTTRLWPANLEALFARAVGPLHLAVFWADVSDRETSGYLEPLADACVEPRAMGWLALSLGLAAQDAALRGHAREGLIALVADGRLDVESLGMTMSRLLDTGFNKLTRWAVSLGEVARVSPAHARPVADLLGRVLQGNPATAPRDLGAVLELYYELLSDTGTVPGIPATRAYLAGLKAGGKVARLAKQLLALPAG